jgi:hypothetical protein
MPLAVLVAGVLWGSVTIGPMTPVCAADAPCSVPAKHASVTFTRPGRSVSVKTDGAGWYHVRLATGRWSVRVSVGMRSTPSAVVVRGGAHRLDLAADTGIR